MEDRARKEKNRAAQKRYREIHGEELRRKGREYWKKRNAEDPERNRAHVKTWREADPEHYRELAGTPTLAAEAEAYLRRAAGQDGDPA